MGLLLLYVAVNDSHFINFPLCVFSIKFCLRDFLVNDPCRPQHGWWKNVKSFEKTDSISSVVKWKDEIFDSSAKMQRLCAVVYWEKKFQKTRQNVINFLGREVKGHLGAVWQVILYFPYRNKILKKTIITCHIATNRKDVMPMIVWIRHRQQKTQKGNRTWQKSCTTPWWIVM